VLAGRSGYLSADESYWRYLLRECREQSWRRCRKLLSFNASADWQRHCDGVRERFRAALGPIPERTPLNPRRVGRLERDGYVVEKLLIESQPGFSVTVNLYVPTNARFPAPAILNPVGHWADAKAEGVVQARGIGLARKGFVALIYDPLGQGERSQFWDTTTNGNPLPAGTSQHSAVSLPCALIGQTVINHMVWDGVRMLDYLESRPDVDAARIGCTGASGGGTYTMFLNAFDPRIKAAVPVCSTSTHERKLAQGQIGEPCQDVAGTYPNDLDMADLLMCGAPNAVRIIAATHDFFPLIGAREVYLDLQRCYQALGIEERASLIEIAAHHDYNQPMREAMYAWFNRWLGNEGADDAEAPYEPEPAQRLWCTATGQLLTSTGGETVLSLNRDRTRAVAAPPPRLETGADASAHREGVRAAVRQILQGVGGPAHASVEHLKETTRDGLVTEQFSFESEPDLLIPGLVVRATERQPDQTVLLLDDRGKEPELAAGGLVESLAHAGCRVATVDLRGWGETAWQRRFPYEQDDFGLLGNDSMLSYVCYLLGKWAVTQRVSDALRTFDYLRSRDDVRASQISVIGRGIAGIVALHAAALDSRIQSVCAYESLASYRSIVEADRYSLPPSAFLPGVLLRYDLPDLAGALAPADTLLVNPLDALGDVLKPEAAGGIYATAARMHQLLGNGDHFVVRTALSRPELVECLCAWASRPAGVTTAR